MAYRGGGHYIGDKLYGTSQGKTDGRYTQRSGAYNSYPPAPAPYSEYAPGEFYNRFNSSSGAAQSTMSYPKGNTSAPAQTSNFSTGAGFDVYKGQDVYGDNYASRSTSQRSGQSKNFPSTDNRQNLTAGRHEDPSYDSKKGDKSYRNAAYNEESSRNPEAHLDSERTKDYSQYKDQSLREQRPSQELDNKGDRHSESDLNIFELLKDERLKNVLFAGISKVTSKLEQSLNRSSEEKVAFMETLKPSSAQLFPSATGEAKPKSILKRSSAKEEEDITKSSVIEKTLQMLQGKPRENLSTTNKGAKPGSNALSQLSSYVDVDDDKYLYDNDVPFMNSQSKEHEGKAPFWSVNAVPPSSSVAVKKDTDSFDIKEKLYEQWRQSIYKSDEAKNTDKKDNLTNVDPYFKKKISDKIDSTASQSSAEPPKKEWEDIDTTVQNILHSIGFNFDLSKRMQELARQKKKQQEDIQTGIVDQSASFLGKNIFSDDFKASFLNSDQKKSSLEALIKEARASSQSNRNYERDSSSINLVNAENSSPHHDNYMRSNSVEIVDGRPSREKYDKRDHEDKFNEDERKVIASRRRDKASPTYPRDRASPTYPRDRASPTYPRDRASPTYPRDRASPTYPRDRVSVSPKGRYSGGFSSSEKYIERLKDEPTEEYFYPEEGDIIKSPLLTTSFSSRKNEDLSSGLLTKRSTNIHVENLRVMAHNTQEEDEPFMESRRIILSSKQDKRPASRSPSYKNLPPESKRRRSISPLFSLSQNVDIREKPRNDDEFSDKRHGITMRSVSPYHDKSRSPDYGSSSHRGFSPEGKVSSYYRSPVRELSPKYRMGYTTHSYSYKKYDNRFSQKDRYDKDGGYSRYNYGKKTDRKRSRSHSPGFPKLSSRPRSRSPFNHSRSPVRHRSRSMERNRRVSPERCHSPLKFSRRSPYRKKRFGHFDRGDKQFDSSKSETLSKAQSIETAKVSTMPEKPPDLNVKKTVNEPFKSGKSLETSKVDISKLGPEERKAYLQKMLQEKVISSDEPKQNILSAIEGLADFSVDQRKELLIKLSKADPVERQKILSDFSQRNARLTFLKRELNKLKRDQNELLRKSWRNGTSGKEPELIKNEEAQGELQKEIDRLTLGGWDIPLERPASPPPMNLKKTEKTKPAPKKQMVESKTGLAQEKQESIAKSLTQEVDSKSKKAVSSSSVVPTQPGTSQDKPKEGEEKVADAKEALNKPKIYFEYVDSGNYWCKHCNCSANNLNQLYQHFHGKKHKNALDKQQKPWKQVKRDNPGSKRVGVAQSRRVKGAELLYPVQGFYCTLCETFCGDFSESTSHLKTDSHYNNYMDYLKKNPMYEKELLLSKTYHSGARDATPKGNKEKKRKNLRVKENEDSESNPDETVYIDNTEIVDMELDEESSEESQPKIPKLAAKQLLAWTPVATSAVVDMKETKEDKVKPLDRFLSIATPHTEGRKSQLPVVTSSSMDLASIPIPQGPCLPGPEKSVIAKAEGVEEKIKVEVEISKVMETDNLSMTIDQNKTCVQDLNIPLPENSGSQIVVEKKTKSIDTLFARLSKNTTHKSKPKQNISAPGITDLDMEKKIQEAIQIKINLEKQKLLRKKQKEEEKERRVEEEQTVRKRYVSDSESSSSEDSDVEVIEHQADECVVEVTESKPEDGPRKVETETTQLTDSHHLVDADCQNQKKEVSSDIDQMETTSSFMDSEKKASSEVGGNKTLVIDLTEETIVITDDQEKTEVDQVSQQSELRTAKDGTEILTTSDGNDQISELSSSNKLSETSIAQDKLPDLTADVHSTDKIDSVPIADVNNDAISSLPAIDIHVEEVNSSSIAVVHSEEINSLPTASAQNEEINSTPAAVIHLKVSSFCDIISKTSNFPLSSNVIPCTVETANEENKFDGLSDAAVTITGDHTEMTLIEGGAPGDKAHVSHLLKTSVCVDEDVQGLTNANAQQDKCPPFVDPVSDQTSISEPSETVGDKNLIHLVDDQNVVNIVDHPTLDKSCAIWDQEQSASSDNLNLAYLPIQSCNSCDSTPFFPMEEEDNQQPHGGSKSLTINECNSNQSLLDAANDSEIADLMADTNNSPDIMVPTNSSPEEMEDDEQLMFGEGLIVLSEITGDNDNDEDCKIIEEIDDGQDEVDVDNNGQLREEPQTDCMAEDLMLTCYQTSGQGNDPPMSGVVSEVEPLDADMVTIPEEETDNLVTENSPTEGLNLDLDEDTIEFDMAEFSEKLAGGADSG